MACTACGRGFHEECEDGCLDCHPDYIKATKSLATVGGGKGRPALDPDDVTDKHSTGRKRAALLYPIFPNKPCDWQGKKNCGGGEPIVGCISGLQVDRHHGPIKNTLRNEPTNIHRICKACHNRWHTVNDPIYNEEEYENLPHNPEPATELELIVAETSWRVRS